MTLPRKGRRNLVVDGIAWVWTAKSEPTVETRAGGRDVHVESRIILEQLERPGRRIIACFDSREFLPTSGRTKYVDFLAMTPSLARAIVLHAQSQGWNSETATRDLVIRDGSDVLRVEVQKALGEQRRMNFCARSAKAR